MKSFEEKKTAKQNKFFSFFYLKIKFLWIHFLSILKIGLIPIDVKQVFPMKPLEFEIFLFVKIYVITISENFRDDYVAEKRIVSKL